jgi:4-aminobutyrate aminotransferase-like enzyme
MTSTHTGNPVCAMAALANIALIIKERLAENARKMGDMLHAELNKIKDRHPGVVGSVQGKGLVAGMHMVKPNSKEPDGDLAFRIVNKSVQKGLLFFSPVGFGSATVKISPPLIITKEAVLDGIQALSEAVDEAVAGK